jgi:hypothetical protein
VLLSSSILPNWAAQEAGPVNSEVVSNPVSTYNASSGDLIAAFAVQSTAGGDETDIVVSAYKPDGSGGLELDTSFGDYNNDGISTIGGGTVGHPGGESGFSIVNVAALINGDPSQVDHFGISPLGIVVDSSGQIDVFFGSFYTGPGGIGLLQLEASGTPNSSFGNWLGLDSGNGQGGNGAEEITIIGTDANPETPFSNAVAIDPLNEDILVAGHSDYFAGGGNFGEIFAFNSSGSSAGSFDSSFGNTLATQVGQFQINNPDDSAANFSRVTADSSGNIFATDSWTGTTPGVGVVKILSDGSAVASSFGSTGWSEITSIPGASGAGTLSDPFGIGLTSDGHIIVGGSANNGYFLSTLDSSGNPVTTADVGQQYIGGYPSGSGPLPPTQMAVNPDGDVVVNANPAFVDSGTWFSGTSNSEALYDPYAPDSTIGNISAAVFYDGGVVLVGSDTPPTGDTNAGTPGLTLAVYGNTPLAPSLTTSAQSIFTHGTTPGIAYGIPLNVDVLHDQPVASGFGVSIEGRSTEGTRNPETIQFTFAGPISEGPDFIVPPPANALGGTDGTFVSASVSGDVLDVVVDNVNNKQTMIVTVNGVMNTSTGVEGSYHIDVGVLWGDTDGDGVVGGSDFTSVITNLGKAVTLSNFRDDFGCDGAIDGTDFTLLVGDLGKSFPGSELP